MSETEFGGMLYKLYHGVVKLETDELKENKACSGLTVNELNLIECIRSLTKGTSGPTISAIASELDITRPSTTVAVNKLVNKKMAVKTGCSNDGRSVRVKLSAKGEKAYAAHHTYQSALLKEAREYFTEAEFKAVSESLTKLYKFFGSKEQNSDGTK